MTRLYCEESGALCCPTGPGIFYQTDAYGNIQYHQPSYTIKPDGRVIETDAYGNKLYHKLQYLIKNNKAIPVDAYGNRQYNKPALVIEGRKSASGNR